MKRSTKVLWIATVFSTIVAAAIAGVIVYFTAFRNSSNSVSSSGNGSADGGGPNSESPSTSQPDSTPTVSPVISGPPPATVPPSTSLSFDHLSHSVPGYKYVEVDYDGDGNEMVQLDGSRSHTHYTEGNPIVQGRLVYMSWFDNSTRQQLATISKPLLKFSVGTHVVGLTVMDNSRDSHTDYATVVVERPIFSGVYVYFYPPSTISGAISLPDDISKGDRPIYAGDVTSINYQDDSEFPSIVRATEFQARCVFIVAGKSGADTSFSVAHYGPVRLIVDGQIVVESNEDGERLTTGSIALSDGDFNAQLLYSRSSSAAAKLVLEVSYSDGSDDQLQYDSSTVVPVLLKIEPLTSTLEGGGYAKLQGVGLSNNVEIDFGGKVLPIDEERSTDSSIFVAVPSSSEPQKVQVSARNNAGVSNGLAFEYLTDGEPPIKFKESLMKMAPNSKGDLNIQLITGIKYGPDHRYYMSAIHSTVYSMATDNDLRVTDLCQSGALGNDRSILGLAFNPADSVGATDDDNFKLYVSASVLEWKEKERLSGALAWANGQVLLMRKNVDGACLALVGDAIISGLPVTDHDHGVNGMVFDQDGKLHLQVGGFTNAGVLDETRLGGLAANPLSGASLVADVNKPGFNGAIKYDVANPRIAQQISGDVSVYMSGLRNSFGITLHSNGMLYATDNGASVGFGAESLSCDSEQELIGENLQDELVRVIDGKYGGHPNRNRGRKDSRECVFKGPDILESDEFYEAPLATFESSTDGILEYTADVFDGQLKGNLICTKYATQESEGKVFRIQLVDGSTDKLKSSPDELWPRSGLSVEMSPFGHLVMPRVFGKQIIVLTPDVRGSDVPTFIGVAPFRGPRSGGNRVMVTGSNFVNGVVASFGGIVCTNVSDVSDDGRAFFCDVPPAKAGATNGVEVSLLFEDSRRNVASTGGVDYLYMNI